MWGDGHSHHLSYYFDVPANGTPVFKLNIDGHHDVCPSTVVSGEKSPECYNHIGYSAVRERYSAVTLVPPKRLRLNIGHFAERFGMLPPSGLITDTITFPPNHSIHLTIDLDAITLFPAYHKWLCGNGFSLSEVLGILERAKETGKLKRLDLGGIINDIPDFSIVSDPRKPSRPEVSQAEAIEAVETVKAYTLSMDVLDTLFSFAVGCYYKILKAAVFV